MSVITHTNVAPWRLVRSLAHVVIQQKKQRPSGFWKLVNDDKRTPQFALPINTPHPVKETQTTTAFHASKVPIVRTTLSSEDLEKQQNAFTRPLASATCEQRQLQSQTSQLTQSRHSSHPILTPALKARKFHLIKDPSPITSHSLIPKTIAQKHRIKRRRDLACFAERPDPIRKAKNSSGVSRQSSGDARHTDNTQEEDILQLEKPRRRPNATAAERKWRIETWANSPKPNGVTENLTRTAEDVSKPSSQWNYESIRLAEQLQAVALEEIHANEKLAKGSSCSGVLKVKPKPPKPRQPKAEELAINGNKDEIVTDIISLDDDADYVLDTYVRSNAQQPFEVAGPAISHYDSLHVIDHGNVGFLVIEDADEEALWETFAEDPEGDLEWNSEEEDENGFLTDSKAMKFTNGII